MIPERIMVRLTGACWHEPIAGLALPATYYPEGGSKGERWYMTDHAAGDDEENFGGWFVEVTGRNTDWAGEIVS